MTVKVTLTTRAPSYSLGFTVDEYADEDDAYWTDGEGKRLEVVKHDGTVVTYPPGSWSKVEGKRGG
jgi:hypothetical protein